MPRSYQAHQRRTVVSLDGYWDFAFLGSQNPDTVDVTSLIYTDRLPVPSCFDALPAFTGLRGLAAYRTSIHLGSGMAHRLIFSAVNHWCRVLVNGVLFQEHMGGFTRFAVDLPVNLSTTDQPIEITVLVSNGFDAERNPLHHEYYDWYQFGGIIRSVELHRLPATYIENCRVMTVDYLSPRVQLSLNYHTTEVEKVVPLRITCDGNVMLDDSVTLAMGDGLLEYDFELPNAALWSPDAPNLHLMTVVLADDDLSVRFGIRQVEVSGQQILLNGQPLRLLGFNRHEFHPHFGHALPDAILMSDIQQLRDLGCNFVRGSHYPQDERFLDLCDEAGLCVWSEGVAWQNKREHLTNPAFVSAQLQHLDAMVSSAVNHPSVVMWGVLNESDSNYAECVPAYQQLLTRLKTLDPTRPVTFATHRPLQDHCLHLADIISVNTYPGWYFGSIADIPAELDKIVAHLDAAGFGDKPLIISEIGAGAIPGWRDSHDVRWTEHYQADLLETVIRTMFVSSSRFAGLAIWLFNDFRTPNQTSLVLGRPRGYNDKGVVDEYRRPKMAYGRVQQHFAALKDTPI